MNPRTPSLASKASIPLDDILSPDIARQLYEITEGAKQRDGKANFHHKPLNDRYFKIGTGDNINLVQERSRQEKDVEDVIDMHATVVGGDALDDTSLSDVAYFDRSEGISKDLTNDEVELLLKPYDKRLEDDMKVIQFGQTLTLQNDFFKTYIDCEDNQSLLTNGNFHLQTSYFRLERVYQGEHRLSFRKIIKLNDDIHVMHQASGRYIGIDSNQRLCLTDHKYVWKIKQNSRNFNTRENSEYERRRQLVKLAETASEDDLFATKNIYVSVRSGSISHIYCNRTSHYLMMDNNELSLFSNIMLRMDSEPTMEPRLNWIFSKPYHLPQIAYNGNLDFIPYKLNHSVENMEMLVIKEVLLTILGVEGMLFTTITVYDESTNIKLSIPIEREVNSSVHANLMSVANRIIECHKCYFFVIAFAKIHGEIGYGTVSNTLSRCLLRYINQHNTTLENLSQSYRDESKSLLSLYVDLQSMRQNMQILEIVTREVFSLHGSSIIASLEKLWEENRYDTFRSVILTDILQELRSAYNEFVLSWVFYGNFVDPFDEFFIQINSNIDKRDLLEDFNAAYWNEKYTLKQNVIIPRYLAEERERIVQTGKYVNIILESKNSQVNFESDQFPFRKLGPGYTLQDKLRLAYKTSSKKLVDIVLKENHLDKCFDIVQNYLLLFEGDFYNEFFEEAGSLLGKYIEEVELDDIEYTVESILHGCLTSSESMDWKAIKVNGFSQLPFRISIEDLPLDEHIHLIHTGSTRESRQKPRIFHLVSFSFEVEWPISLILSNQLLTKYSLLFRLIFVLKYAEDKLKHRMVALRRDMSSSHETARAQLMHHFVNNMLYYIMFEVIEVRYIKFQESLQKSTEIEEIISLSSNYVDGLLRECLLTHENILTKMYEVIECVLKNDTNFPAIFSSFFDMLSHEVWTNNYYFLRNLCVRLDFNGYLESKLFRNTNSRHIGS